MTPQERVLLEDFLHQLGNVPGVQKDAEADALIRQQAARQPDALYLSIQRALILDHAVQGAQERILALEQKVRTLEAAAQAANKPVHGSFLSGLTDGWGRPAEPVSAAPDASQASSGSMIGSRIGPGPGWAGGTGVPQQGFQASPAAPPRTGAMAAMGAMGNSGMGHFLGNAAAAAAGVAGGMFLFNGIERLMGGGPGLGTGLAGPPVSENITENVTNNFFDGVAVPSPSDAAQVARADTLADSSADTPADDGGWFDTSGFFGDDSDIV